MCICVLCMLYTSTSIYLFIYMCIYICMVRVKMLLFACVNTYAYIFTKVEGLRTPVVWNNPHETFV